MSHLKTTGRILEKKVEYYWVLRENEEKMRNRAMIPRDAGWHCIRLPKRLKQIGSHFEILLSFSRPAGKP